MIVMDGKAVAAKCKAAAAEEAKKLKECRGKLYQTMGVTVGALLTLLII